MTVIASATKKERKTGKTIYSFTVNDNAFEAHYFAGKKPALEIMHNGTLLGLVSEPKTKFEFVANPETFPVKITAWIEAGNSFSSLITSAAKGAGIEVDGNPVQNTLTDPGFHIKNGKSGYYVLLFILAAKSLFAYYSSFKGYESRLVAAVSAAVYFVPLLLALVFFINYVRWTTAALFLGIILSILEFIDYAMGIPGSIGSGTNAASILMWVILRAAALYLFFNALKWKNRQKERPAPAPDAS